MTINCLNCGFFIPERDFRKDLRPEVHGAGIDGACGEDMNSLLGIRYIRNADRTKCGRHYREKISET